MDDNIKLLRKAREGDRKARDRLVEANAGLVWSIVRRFSNRGCEIEDLFQIGNIGLIKAIDHFDFSFDVRFSTYAVPIITGEIKRFLRDDGLLKVSRSLKETALRARLAREELAGELGREPTLSELSKAMGVEGEELAAALDSAAEVESLSQTIYQGDGRDISLLDKIEDQRNQEECILNRHAVREMLGHLEPDEQKLIMMRYYADRTQTQIAIELGISQVQVSRLEKRILRKMRRSWE